MSELIITTKKLRTRHKYTFNLWDLGLFNLKLYIN